MGWAWRRVDSDLFLGWVPARYTGDDLFMVTGKVTFRPWTLEAAGWRLRPLTASAQLTYTFGERFTTFPADDLPPTALRAGIAVGAAVGRRVGGTDVDVYAELVGLDVGLYYWISDRATVGLADVFSVAFGVRIQL